MQFFHFNSRPHEEVDPASNVTAGTYLAFQLTISRGGRPDSRAFYTVAICISTHDLARRSTPWFHHYCFGTFLFQLTTSQVGRQVVTIDNAQLFLISTHDLTRRSTSVRDDLWHGKSISTHDLTRRSTSWSPCSIGRPYISTHDLTRRSTALHTEKNQMHFYFNSRPHKEVDSILQSSLRNHLYFNSRPHKEVDAFIFFLSGSGLSISTHDLTRRSTSCFLQAVMMPLYFNSRPHKEVDI